MILTRDELKAQFNLATDEGADKFLDLLSESTNPRLQVTTVLGERLLSLDDEYWQNLLSFVANMRTQSD